MSERHVNLRFRREIGVEIAIAISLVLAVSLVAFETIAGFQRFPAVHAVVGVIASFLAPGYLLLLVSGHNPRRSSRLFVYAVGISVAFLIGLGMLVNFLLAGFGVERPLSTLPWFVALSLVVLSAASYYRTDGRVDSVRSVSISSRSLLSGTLLALLPILSVTAARVISDEGSQVPMFVLILLVVTVVLLLVAGAIPPQMRPFAIWSTALAVQFQTTMISSHLWGWDIHFQYRIAETILQTGYWTPVNGSSSSSLLSTTLLPVIATFTTGLDLVWIYKLVYPCLIALLPVAIFHIGALQFDDEWIATLSPFALVFYYGYFKFMPGKQMFAQLFFAFTLVVLFDDSVHGIGKRALAVTFATVMILSHYVVSLSFVMVLTATVVTVSTAYQVGLIDRVDTSITRPTFATLVGVGWFSWYAFSSFGSNFDRIVLRGYETFSTLGSGSPGRSGASYATEAFGSPLWILYKLLYIAIIFWFTVGVLWTLYTILMERTDRVDVEYAVLASFVLGFLASSIVVTYSLGFDRALFLALVPLAPFVPVGLKAGAEVLFSLTNRTVRIPSRGVAGVFAVFLAVLFLFSSGFVFAAAGEEIPSYNINLDEDAGWPVYEQNEVAASRWVAHSTAPSSKVAVYNQWEALKSRDALLLREVISTERLVPVLPSNSQVEGTPYIYVSEKPMVKKIGERVYIDPQQTTFYAETIVRANRVYSAGNVDIYVPRPEDGGSSRGGPAASNQTDERSRPTPRNATSERVSHPSASETIRYRQANIPGY